MIDYTLILLTNYPKTEWTIDGDAYEGLVWLDESPKPTQAELDALWENTLETVKENKKSQADARQSALNKLMALGLTEEEAIALGAK